MNSMYTIKTTAPDGTRRVTRIRLRSWPDTYVDETVGMIREWIEVRNKRQTSPEEMAEESCSTV